MKKSNKKESASMSELLGILSYSERDTCFHLEGGGCLDIVRVICSDFQAIRDIDLEYENLKLQQFYSRYPADLKLVLREYAGTVYGADSICHSQVGVLPGDRS